MLDSDSSAEFAFVLEDALPSESSPALGIDSTLQELPSYDIRLPVETLGVEAARLFEQMPDLPGIILTDSDSWVGVMSRQRFLEYLLRPQGCELFLSYPLSVFHSYARLKPLSLTATTPILIAAQTALRRPIELQGEPILVVGERGDRLLSAQDLNVAHWQIRGIETQVRYERSQAQMLQNQKMASLGRLVDGVAHEILDPLSFIWGNLTHVSHYCQQLLALVDHYDAVLAAEAIAARHSLDEHKTAIELDYLRIDLPDALRSIQGGADRLKQLATSLQNFCYVDEVYPKPADLHDLIDSVVLLLKSRLTTRIAVDRQYAALPPIPCFAGQLSQVFMNVLSHCLDTLLLQAARQTLPEGLHLKNSPTQSVPTVAAPPQIFISTHLCEATPEDAVVAQRWVVITVADNGPGLSPEAQNLLQQSFSIAQRLERETDLAMSYRIITAKHSGKFCVRSRTLPALAPTAGIGTEFEIRLPLYTPQSEPLTPGKSALGHTPNPTNHSLKH